MKHKLLLLFSCIPLFCSGCGDYAVTLPGQYQLIRANGNEIYISNPEPNGEIILGPSIEGYAVSGRFVIGYIKRGNWPVEFQPKMVDGYFVLDTTSGNIKQKLSIAAWRKELKALGVDNTPALKTP